MLLKMEEGALGNYFEMVKLLNIVDGWRENDIFKYLDFWQFETWERGEKADGQN